MRRRREKAISGAMPLASARRHQSWSCITRCSLEAIELMELLRTPDARKALEELSRDALIAQIRLAAAEALERMNRPERPPEKKKG